MSESPEYGTEDYRRWAVLFNDITHTRTMQRLLFSDRRALTDHLWTQGWRREVRPEDVTERPDPRPCRGTNANICVAEGCYGETCRSVDALAGMETHAATADTDERGRA